MKNSSFSVFYFGGHPYQQVNWPSLVLEPVKFLHVSASPNMGQSKHPHLMCKGPKRRRVDYDGSKNRSETGLCLVPVAVAGDCWFSNINTGRILPYLVQWMERSSCTHLNLAICPTDNIVASYTTLIYVCTLILDPCDNNSSRHHDCSDGNFSTPVGSTYTCCCRTFEDRMNGKDLG